MKISRKVLARVITDKLNQSNNPRYLAKEIGAYLIASRRLNELDSILRDIINYRAQNGLLEMSIVSVNKLSDDLRERIINLGNSQAKYKSKHTIVNESIDKSLVSGFSVDIAADRRLDLSVRNKVNQFKQLVN